MSNCEGNLTCQWSPIGFSEEITGDVTHEFLRKIRRLFFVNQIILPKICHGAEQKLIHFTPSTPTLLKLATHLDEFSPKTGHFIMNEFC